MSHAGAGETSGPGGSGPRGQPRPQPEPYLVLIVEDDEPLAEALTLLVADAGYTVLRAAHGREGFALYREHWPALVITDLMMPYMSGAELIAAVRTEAAATDRRAPPIILVTAAGGRQAQAAGADAVVGKPFDLVEIDALLLRYLGPPGVGAEGLSRGS